jgi:hypothetical protein
VVNFYYASIADVREEGVEQRPYGDKRVRKLIRQASRTIDILTGQWFYPLRETRKLNGQDSPVVYDPSKIPIVKVFAVEVDASKSTFHNRVLTLPMPGAYGPSDFPWDSAHGCGTVIESLRDLEYEVRDRYIERIGGVFPEGVNNVEADGVWGWIEGPKEITTTTTTDFQRDSEELILDDVSGIFPKDVVRISKDGAEAYILVTDVDTSNKKINFDKVHEWVETVASGAAVEVYGRVPELIERACVRLVVLNKDLMTSPEFSHAQIQGQIKKERTDNYQYELFTADEGGGGIGGGSKTTGDAMTDRILQEYTAPLHFGIV